MMKPLKGLAYQSHQESTEAQPHATGIAFKELQSHLRSVDWFWSASLIAPEPLHYIDVQNWFFSFNNFDDHLLSCFDLLLLYTFFNLWISVCEALWAACLQKVLLAWGAKLKKTEVLHCITRLTLNVFITFKCEKSKFPTTRKQMLQWLTSFSFY